MSGVKFEMLGTIAGSKPSDRRVEALSPQTAVISLWADFIAVFQMSFAEFTLLDTRCTPNASAKASDNGKRKDNTFANGKGQGQGVRNGKGKGVRQRHLGHFIVLPSLVISYACHPG